MMRRRWMAAAMAAVVLAAGAAWAEEATKGKEQPKMQFPQLTISNDALKLVVYLPDAEKGFCRATRFDWSGQIARVEFAGHTAFGPFRPKYNALGNDNVVGPAEEFDMYVPQGYAEAKQGDPFVKIGVGVLERSDEKEYGFWMNYKVLKLPAWKVTSGKDWVEMRQDLEQGGWGYAYTKRIALAPEGIGFLLSHTLKNTGTKAIDTVVYCHNFTIFDDDPIGPNYVVTFPFKTAVTKDSKGPAAFKDNTLTFPAVLKESVWAQFEGIKGTADENAFTIENAAKGVTMKVKGDQPPEMMRFYAEATAACPEPFTRIKVPAGEEKKWGSTYTFTVKAAAKPAEKAADKAAEKAGDKK